MAASLPRFITFGLLSVGTMKSRVFNNFVPSNLNQSKERIKEIARDIGQDELQRAVHHLPHRLECNIDQDGGPFEHLLS